MGINNLSPENDITGLVRELGGYALLISSTEALVWAVLFGWKTCFYILGGSIIAVVNLVLLKKALEAFLKKNNTTRAMVSWWLMYFFRYLLMGAFLFGAGYFHGTKAIFAGALGLFSLRLAIFLSAFGRKGSNHCL